MLWITDSNAKTLVKCRWIGAEHAYRERRSSAGGHLSHCISHHRLPERRCDRVSEERFSRRVATTATAAAAAATATATSPEVYGASNARGCAVRLDPVLHRDKEVRDRTPTNKDVLSACDDVLAARRPSLSTMTSSLTHAVGWRSLGHGVDLEDFPNGAVFR